MTKPITVLMIHNRYQQRGGEDVSFEADVKLLRDCGHAVVVYEAENRRLDAMGRCHAFLRTAWSRESARETVALIQRHRPSIMHVHNTFPLMSPSVVYAAARCGLPVVVQLSNYRLLCPNALFLRCGVICEDCLGRPVPWPAIRYACYRNSRPATAAVVTMLSLHRLLRTWQRNVVRFITLSEFARAKFIAGGFDPERIAVRANYLSNDPGRGAGDRSGILFVGMLHPWKGADVLLEAWRRAPGDEIVTFVGSGPEEAGLRRAADGLPRVEFVGHCGVTDVYAHMKKVRFLVFPSVVYETFGRTLVEAFACGTPVIASRLGPAADIVRDGETGLHFQPGNAADLASKIAWARAHPEAMGRMGRAARYEYETRYTAEAAYRRLMAIYRDALSI